MLDYFLLDVSWTLVGIAYNFLGALMLSDFHLGPSHLTAQIFSDTHDDPLQKLLEYRIKSRVKEEMGFKVLMIGFFITFTAESGIIRLLF